MILVRTDKNKRLMQVWMGKAILISDGNMDSVGNWTECLTSMLWGKKQTECTVLPWSFCGKLSLEMMN